METASTTFHPRSRKACEGNHESPHDCGGLLARWILGIDARYCDATGGEWYMRQAADGVAATPCICINGLLDELSRPHGQYLPFWQRMIALGQSVWWYSLDHGGVSAACFTIQSEFSLYLWAAVQALVFPPCRG